MSKEHLCSRLLTATSSARVASPVARTPSRGMGTQLQLRRSRSQLARQQRYLSLGRQRTTTTPGCSRADRASAQGSLPNTRADESVHARSQSFYAAGIELSCSRCRRSAPYASRREWRVVRGGIVCPGCLTSTDLADLQDEDRPQPQCVYCRRERTPGESAWNPLRRRHAPLALQNGAPNELIHVCSDCLQRRAMHLPTASGGR
jgi:hypothetical protein